MSLDMVKEKFHKAIEWGEKNLPENKFKIYEALLNREQEYLFGEYASEVTDTSKIDTVATVFIPIVKKFVQDNVIDKITSVQPIKSVPANVLVLTSVYSETDTRSGAIAGKEIDDGTQDYSRTPGEGVNITRGVDLDLRVVQTESNIRKLVAKWTFEAEEMVKNVGIDIMEELTRAMAWKITSEVQYHVLNDLYTSASGGTTEWKIPGPTATPKEVERAEKELFYRILDVASMVYEKEGFYPNFIVCNPKMAAVLKRQYSWAPVGKEMPNKISSFYTEGVINDEFNLYVVRHLTTDDILVGYKDDNNDISAGYIFCPYKFPFMTDPLADPRTLTIVRSVGAWFCTAFPVKERYGIVKVVS